MESKTVKENYKREFLYILFSHINFIMGITLLFLIIGVLIAFFWPPTYSATAKIMVQGKGVDQNLGALEAVREKVRVFKVSKEDLTSEKQLIVSYSVIFRTIEALKKKKLYRKCVKNKGFFSKVTGFFKLKNRRNKEPIIVEKKYLSLADDAYLIRKNLKSEIIAGSNVVKVVFFDRDPKYAVIFLKELVKQYRKYRTLVFNPSRKIDFFKKQAERFNKELKLKDEEFLKIARKTGIPDPESEIKKNIALQKNLEVILNSLESKRLEKKYTILQIDETLKRKKAQQSFSFINNKVINDLETELTKRRLHRITLMKIYVPTAQKIRLEDDEIRNIYSLLKKKVRAYRDGLANELRILEMQIEETRKRINNLNKQNALLQKQVFMYQKINLEKDLLKYSFETFLKRSEEARINNIAAQSNFSTFIKILSNAIPSDGPVFPRKTQVIPISLLIGLILGLTLAFLSEYFDHTFKKPEDVETTLSLPVLFSIPEAATVSNRKKSSRLDGKLVNSTPNHQQPYSQINVPKSKNLTYLIIVLIILNSFIIIFIAINYFTTQNAMLHLINSYLTPNQNQTKKINASQFKPSKIKINPSVLEIERDNIRLEKSKKNQKDKKVLEKIKITEGAKSGYSDIEELGKKQYLRHKKLSESKKVFSKKYNTYTLLNTMNRHAVRLRSKSRFRKLNILSQKKIKKTRDILSVSSGKISTRRTRRTRRSLHYNQRKVFSIAKLIQNSLILHHKNFYCLQVQSLKNKEDAYREAERLRKTGLKNVSIQKKYIENYGITYRVLIGNFSNKKDALNYKEDWKSIFVKNFLAIKEIGN